MRTEAFNSARAVCAIVGVAAALCVLPVHAEDGPQVALQPGQRLQFADAEAESLESAVDLQNGGAVEQETVTLFVGANAELLEFAVVAEESRAFDEYADPDQVAVRYWGDGEAIALLQEIVWTFDVDAPENRMLPLGIAPFSSDTTPDPRFLAAVAVMTTIQRSVLLMGDEDGLVGVRTAPPDRRQGRQVHRN